MKVVRYVVILTSILTYLPTLAQDWVEIGPRNGFIKVSCDLGKKLFGFHGDTLMVSDSSMENWTSLPFVRAAGVVRAGNRLYVYGNLGVYVSLDTGKNWLKAVNGLTLDGSPQGYGYHIHDAAVKNDTVFVAVWGSPFATGASIMRSTDGGNSWASVLSDGYNEISMDLIGVSKKSVFLFHKQMAKRMYKRTTDGGSNWVEFGNSVFSSSPLLCVAANDSEVFFGTTKGVYASENEGTLMTPRGLANVKVNSLCVDDPAIYAATDSGLFTSMDNGVSWTQSSYFDSSIALVEIAKIDGRFYTRTENATFISFDDGNSWIRSSAGATNIPMKDVTVLGGDIYALSDDGESLYLSHNGGKTWQQFSTSIPFNFVRAPDRELYATFPTGIKQGADRKTRMDWITTAIPDGVKEIRSYSSGWVAASASAVHTSSDLGSTWQTTSLGLETPLSTSAVVDDTYFYVAGASKLFRRAASDEVWSTLAMPLPGFSNIILFERKNTLFLGVSHSSQNMAKLLTSTDQGTSWTEVASFQSRSFLPVKMLDDTMLVVVGRGLHRSTSDGQTWETLSTTPAGPINNFATEFGRVYLATPSGVWTTNGLGSGTGNVPHRMLEQQRIVVYPTPCDTYVRLELPDEVSDIALEVRDLLGAPRRVAFDRIDATSLKIFTSTLSDGLYFVAVTAPGFHVSTQVIVRH